MQVRLLFSLLLQQGTGGIRALKLWHCSTAVYRKVMLVDMQWRASSTPKVALWVQPTPSRMKLAEWNFSPPPHCCSPLRHSEFPWGPRSPLKQCRGKGHVCNDREGLAQDCPSLPKEVNGTWIQPFVWYAKPLSLVPHSTLSTLLEHTGSLLPIGCVLRAGGSLCYSVLEMGVQSGVEAAFWCASLLR